MPYDMKKGGDNAQLPRLEDRPLRGRRFHVRRYRPRGGPVDGGHGLRPDPDHDRLHRPGPVGPDGRPADRRRADRPLRGHRLGPQAPQEPLTRRGRASRAAVLMATVLLACVVAFAHSPAIAGATVIEPIDVPANWTSIWNTVAPGGTAPLDMGGIYSSGGTAGTAAQRAALATLIESESASGALSGVGIAAAFSPITLGVAGFAATVLVGQNMIQEWLLPPALTSPQTLGIKLFASAAPMTFYKYSGASGTENVPAL